MYWYVSCTYKWTLDFHFYDIFIYTKALYQNMITIPTAVTYKRLHRNVSFAGNIS